MSFQSLNSDQLYRQFANEPTEYRHFVFRISNECPGKQENQMFETKRRRTPDDPLLQITPLHHLIPYVPLPVLYIPSPVLYIPPARLVFEKAPTEPYSNIQMRRTFQRRREQTNKFGSNHNRLQPCML